MRNLQKILIKKLKILHLIKAFLTLADFRKWGPFLDAAVESKFDHAFTISWSQCAEDIVFCNINESKSGRYIDVGAHHPNRFSVTRKLYEKGWNGVNIEANADLLSEFFKRRKRDINLNYAVGSKDKYQLTIFMEPALSTVNLKWKKKYLEEKNIVQKIVEVPGKTLYEIQLEYGKGAKFDLLNVDVEGSDLDVIKSFNFEKLDCSLYPSCIIIEMKPGIENISKSELSNHLMKFGYKIYCILPMSTIFILTS